MAAASATSTIAMPTTCRAATDSPRKMAAVTVEMTGMLSVIVDEAHSGRWGIETLIRKWPPTPETMASPTIHSHDVSVGHDRSWRKAAAAGHATSVATMAVMAAYSSAAMLLRIMRDATK